ncbi:MAG: hypothetical protein ACRDF7_00055 [Candidatus Limnocylindrales bacterium]
MTAELAQQRSDIQVGTGVRWSTSFDLENTFVARVFEHRPEPTDDSGLRALYARLAAEYEAEPTVPDHGGGLAEDRYQF